MHDAFLAAIIESPADDTPRLVYADWLDEHGQPERAEFIRVQCEIVRFENHFGYPVPPNIHYHALRRRERELLDATPFGMRNANWWALALADMGDIQWEWRRGFVESVTCAAADWLARGDAIRRAQPVTRVVLTTWPDEPMDWRDVTAEDGKLVYAAHRTTRWPGVTFELPPAGGLPRYTGPLRASLP